MRIARAALARPLSSRTPARTAERPDSSRPPLEIVPCAGVQEAISARFDGEEAWLSARAIDRHLRRCGTCRAFEAALPALQEHFPPPGNDAGSPLTAALPRWRWWGGGLAGSVQWLAIVVPVAIAVASLAGFDLTHAHLVAHRLGKHCMEHLPALLAHRSWH